MRMPSLIAAIALPAAIAFASPVVAQSENAQAFVNKAAVSDIFEIESSELALNRAKDPQVKDFAQMMIADHGKSSQMLQQIASAQGLNVPTSLDEEHQAKLQTLEQAGDEIDAQYVQMQVDGHENAVAMFENYASTGEDPKLQQFAQDTLPILKQHLEKIQTVSKGLGTSQ